MFVGWNTIREYKWNRIGFQKLMQKVRISYATCGHKNKRNIFSITIIVAAALSERKNVETFRLQTRSYCCVAMEWRSCHCNHPWQIRHECNDRYVFNNEDSLHSFKLIRCVQIARQFFSSTTIEERIELFMNNRKFVSNYLYRKMNWNRKLNCE